MGGALLSKPWRDMPGDKESHLKYVKEYKPQNTEYQHIRILLHGPVGAGKSSFINSVNSVLQGRMTCRAPDDAVSGKSYTRKYKAYRFQKESPTSFYSFVFNDTMGIEEDENSGVCVEDIKLAMMGHVKDGYEFKPGTTLSKACKGYNASPTPNDKVHVLVCVIPADNLAIISDKVIAKMREVRLAAKELGIPQLAILTKIDVACDKVNENIKNVHKSKSLKQKVEVVHATLGFSLNRIFLVKNYHSEVSVNDDVDTLILSTLRQMISYGEDFLNDV